MAAAAAATDQLAEGFARIAEVIRAMHGLEGVWEECTEVHFDRLRRGIPQQHREESHTVIFGDALLWIAQHPGCTKRKLTAFVARQVDLHVKAAERQSRQVPAGLSPVPGGSGEATEDTVIRRLMVHRLMARLHPRDRRRILMKVLGVRDKELAQQPREAFAVLRKASGDLASDQSRRRRKYSSTRSSLTRARKRASDLWRAPGLIPLLQTLQRLTAKPRTGNGTPPSGHSRGHRVAVATSVIVAVLAPWGWPLTPPPLNPPRGEAPAPLPAPSLPALSGLGVALANLPGHPLRSQVHPSPRATSVAASARPGHTAAEETPEDTDLTAVTPADRYSDNHRLVASGVGRTCRCSVLFESDDGGATWVAAVGPDGPVWRVVLPPSYPDDPRILAVPLPASGLLTQITERFGQAFHHLLLPVGQLALPPDFDEGNERVYVATVDGVVSTALRGAGGARAELTYPVAPMTMASLVPGTGEAGEDMMILAPGGAVPPPSVATVRLAGTTSPALAAPQSTLFMCAASGGCTGRGQVPLADGAVLAASDPAAQGRPLLAYTGVAMAVSGDGGWTWHSIALPRDTRSVVSAAVSGDGNAGRLWCVCMGTDGQTRVLRSPFAGVSWEDVTGQLTPSTRSAEVSVVAPDRVLDLISDGGYRCLDPSRRHAEWQSRCDPPIAQDDRR
jgi:hypothetical protein